MPEPQINPLNPTRQPPNSLEAEQSLLGALMLSERAWDQVADQLREDDFYRQQHRLIWRAIAELKANSEPTDAVTVSEWFRDRELLDRVENGAYLTMLANDTPGTSNTMAYARRIRDKSMLRTLIEVGTGMADAALQPGARTPADLVEKAQARLFELTELGQAKHEHTLAEGIAAATDDLIAAMDADGALRGITSGLTDLDDHTGGWQPTDLIVIGARPAMGKTSLLLGMARAAGWAQHPVGMASAEQPLVQLAQRHQAADARVSLARMRQGRINNPESEKLLQSGRRLSRLPHWIFDRSGPSISEIVRVARKWRQLHGIKALYVDYLQRIQAPGKDKTERVGEVAYQLKTLARDLEIPVIALAQVNREVEKRPDKRPGMADLRNSGEIEQEADLICFLYRDEVYNPESMDAGIAEIIMGKNRHGYIGTVRVAWAGEFVRFDNLDRRGAA